MAGAGWWEQPSDRGRQRGSGSAAPPQFHFGFQPAEVGSPGGDAAGATSSAGRQRRQQHAKSRGRGPATHAPHVSEVTPPPAYFIPASAAMSLDTGSPGGMPPKPQQQRSGVRALAQQQPRAAASLDTSMGTAAASSSSLTLMRGDDNDDDEDSDATSKESPAPGAARQNRRARRAHLQRAPPPPDSSSPSSGGFASPGAAQLPLNLPPGLPQGFSLAPQQLQGGFCFSPQQGTGGVQQPFVFSAATPPALPLRQRTSPLQAPPNLSPLSLGTALPSPGGNGSGRKQRFKEHLKHEELGQGLKRGSLFRAPFRSNAHDRTQAFATVAGLPSDLMIRGLSAQNRAVEGDEVALQILPPSQWFISGPLLQAAASARAASAAAAANAVVPVSAVGVCALEEEAALLGPGDALQEALSGSVLEASDNPAAAADDEADSGAPDQAEATCEAGGGREAPDQAVEAKRAKRREEKKAFKRRSLPPPPPPSPGQDLIGAARAQLEARFGNSDAAPWDAAGSPQAALAIVAALLSERPELRATAKVVGILEPSRRRGQVVGVLKEEPGGGPLFLCPCDPRLPRAVVRGAELPPQLRLALQAEAHNQVSSARTLVSGALEAWGPYDAFPLAAIRSSLGQAGELATETKAMLAMEAVPDAEFEPGVLACLPATPWAISGDEIARRRDLRSTRIFSIDPPTARDLDDALSIEPLPGGDEEGGNAAWRVGVHIADVAHFVPPGSALDDEARARGTSVYLVDRVIPMLPRLLCEQLCSLNPGVDRLAFSVLWDMAADGAILRQWAGRSVIRACAKLAYGHAQAMIEGGCDAAAPPVCGDVLALHGIAARMRAKRFAGGALRLDNVKLDFRLDADGNPCQATPHGARTTLAPLAL